VTVLISVYIFVHTFKILKESLGILMQFAPGEINQSELIDALREIPEIKDVHHIHLWRLADHKIYFEAHLVLNSDLPISNTQPVTENAKRLLNSRFGIGHTTFQYEYVLCRECEC
jgi:cobalt-zinc-cadmium efflux system protein